MTTGTVTTTGGAKLRCSLAGIPEYEVQKHLKEVEDGIEAKAEYERLEKSREGEKERAQLREKFTMSMTNLESRGPNLWFWERNIHD